MEIESQLFIFLQKFNQRNTVEFYTSSRDLWKLLLAIT